MPALIVRRAPLCVRRFGTVSALLITIVITLVVVVVVAVVVVVVVVAAVSFGLSSRPDRRPTKHLEHGAALKRQARPRR